MNTDAPSPAADPAQPGEAETLAYTVPEYQAGMRLDKLLASLPGVPSRQAAQRWLTDGLVQLNGQRAQGKTKMQAGDALVVQVPALEPLNLLAEAGPLEVLFEDDWLVVINKPAGLAVHPGPGNRTGTLVHRLLHHCQGSLSGIGGVERPGIVHRLDKETSGVLVVAKSDASHRYLSQLFHDHTIERAYLALTFGGPQAYEGRSGTIDAPLGRDANNRLKQAVRDDGRRAVTHWQIVERAGPLTLFEVRLETGRTHQIRVHLAHKNWPVVGDPVYGKARHRGLNLPPELKAAIDGFGRQALHARLLGFNHPADGRPLRFEAPPPDDMAGLVARLKAYLAGAR